MTSRSLIGFPLAGVIIACLYTRATIVLAFMLNGAVIYDFYYMKFKLGVSMSMSLLILIGMLIFNNYNLWLYYEHDLLSLFIICFITQLSDVYQFIVGQRYGIFKIGWISPKKTYEGYLYGAIMTIATFVWIINAWDVLFIYTLGCLSGLISSILKRSLKIKDYSNLLGLHGGWIDRIDSIILPVLLYPVFTEKPIAWSIPFYS